MASLKSGLFDIHFDTLPVTQAKFRRWSDGSIPVLASYSASQEALNLPSLAVSATTIEKKATA